MSVMDDAQILWEYHQMHHELGACSAGIGIGSYDRGVATYSAELFHRGIPGSLGSSQASGGGGCGCHVAASRSDDPRSPHSEAVGPAIAVRRAADLSLRGVTAVCTGPDQVPRDVGINQDRSVAGDAYPRSISASI